MMLPTNPTNPTNPTKVVILWNQNAFAKKLEKKGIIIITSDTKIEKLVPKDVQYIFILIELNWTKLGNYDNLLGINYLYRFFLKKEWKNTQMFLVSIFNSRKLSEIREDFIPIIKTFESQLISPLKMYLNLTDKKLIEATELPIKTKSQRALKAVQAIYHEINQDFSNKHDSLASNLVKYALNLELSEYDIAQKSMREQVVEKLSVLIENVKVIELEIKEKEEKIYRKIFKNNINMIDLSESILKMEKEQTLRKHILYITRRLNTEYFQPGSSVNEFITQLQFN